MNDIKEPGMTKQYVCIAENTDMHLMRVLEITGDLDTAKRVCVSHIYEVAEGEKDPDLKIECSMWKDEVAGISITYQLRGEKTDSTVYKVRILYFERDWKEIMDRLRNLSEATDTPIVTTTQKPLKKTPTDIKDEIKDYKKLIGPPSHPQNEYMEYNFKYLSTKLQGDTLIPILNMNAFKWGFPYMIMTNIPTWEDGRSTYKDSVVVTYGIAAYLSKDDTTVIFISTYDELGDTMFGRAREIRVNVKDLCSRVKIKCVGMIEGGIL